MKGHDHDPVWGEWAYDADARMWTRQCQVEGCPWTQGTSEDPAKPTPLGGALNKLAGIE